MQPARGLPTAEREDDLGESVQRMKGWRAMLYFGTKGKLAKSPVRRHVKGDDGRLSAPYRGVDSSTRS
jgi:hypothetical protein